MGKVIEGLGTTLTIGSASFSYVTLKGLGLTTGEALGATDLANSGYVTKLPPKLIEIPDVTFSAQYAPENYDAIVAELGENQQLVLSFNPRGTALGTVTFWGYLASFDPAEGAVGSAWTGTGSVVVTNMTSGYVESGPVWASA